MRKGPLAAAIPLCVAMLVAVSTSTAWATVPAKKHNKLPKDACALVTDEQVAALVPSATFAPTEKQPNGVGCSWRDGRDIPESLATLNVSVLKLAGVPTAEIKLSLKVEAQDAGAKPIKGLGTFAFQESVIPPNTEVKALIGKLFFSVEFSGEGPVTDEAKATTLAIAKAVAKQI